MRKSLIAEALRYGMHCQGISQFYLHMHAFIDKCNESDLPLPSSRSWSSSTDLRGMEDLAYCMTKRTLTEYMDKLGQQLLREIA